MKDVNVTLSWSEVSTAADVGKFRQIRSLQKALKDKHGFNGEDGWTIHVEGAAGEMAFAKVMNVYWSMACDVFKAPDIGGNVQIRTRSKDNYELIVRPDDRDTDVFVLVTGRIPNFCVRGWIVGRDAKRAEWSKTYANRPAAFFVPQSELKDLSELVIKPEGVHDKVSTHTTPGYVMPPGTMKLPTSCSFEDVPNFNL
jgi:hypothetical protein